MRDGLRGVSVGFQAIGGVPAERNSGSGGFGLEALGGVDAERKSGSGRFCLQSFRCVVGDERIDRGLEHALHDHGELVVG